MTRTITAQLAFWFAIMGVIWLTACGHVPITSLYALSKIDFETTDPAQIRAAIKVPKMIKPRPGGMRLHVTVKVGNAEDAEDFALTEITDPAELAGLNYALDPGTALFAYQIVPKDAARLEAFRAKLLDKKKQGGHGNLGIAIVPEACRTGTLPRGSLPFTTYLRTSETQTYVPLAADVDLRTLDPKRDIAALIPACT